MKRDDLNLLKLLRQDSRIKLADVARRLNLPLTTVNDKYSRLKNTVIMKHATLLNYSRLNPIRVNIVLEAKKKSQLEEFLLAHHSVNSLSRLKDQDFYVDCIFLSMAKLHEFLDQLDRFKVKRTIHHVIEEVKVEDFLSKDEHVRMILSDHS